MSVCLELVLPQPVRLRYAVGELEMTSLDNRHDG
jgi:hypothetical protein